MIPSLLHLRVAHGAGSGWGLWLPLFLLWIPVLLLAPLLELCLMLYCAIAQVNLWLMHGALWALAQMGGTRVEAETPGAKVLIRLM